MRKEKGESAGGTDFGCRQGRGGEPRTWRILVRHPRKKEICWLAEIGGTWNKPKREGIAKALVTNIKGLPNDVPHQAVPWEERGTNEMKKKKKSLKSADHFCSPTEDLLRGQGGGEKRGYFGSSGQERGIFFHREREKGGGLQKKKEGKLESGPNHERVLIRKGEEKHLQQKKSTRNRKKRRRRLIDQRRKGGFGKAVFSDEDG